ncbi:MAG: GAP family protein [Acidimicrobiia bacterium]
MDLVARVLPLALGAAVSPTMLAVVLLLLAARDHGRRLALAFAVGAVIPLAAITVGAMTVWRAAANKAEHPSAVSAGVDLAFGLVLLLLGLHMMFTKPSQQSHEPREFGVKTAFLFGLAIMATNFSSLILDLPALKEVVGARASFGSKATATAIILGFTMLPAIGPILFAYAAPATADRIFGRLRDAVTRHQRTIGVALALIFGVYLCVKGARGF